MENENKIIEGMENNGNKDDKANDSLLNVLVFGSEEKLLSKEDSEKLIGNKIWLRYQPLITRHSRHIDYQDPVYSKINSTYSAGELSTSGLEAEWPRISADQSELYKILNERGYILEHRGRSGFSSRNSYLVCKKDPKKQKIKAPLVTEGGLERSDKMKFGLEGNRVSSDHYVVWTGKIYEGEIILESEVKESEDAIEQAKQEVEKRRIQKLIEYIDQNKKGDISTISVGGGPESFSRRELPENYEVISEKRIACTADHRRNMTHIYQLLIIDKNLFEKKSFFKIKVPDEYKGIVIGKGGSKIKELSEKFTCKIKIE
ncbi:MAG: KH domain-containing protein [Candidatus Absconditicoccaceae bacterium]